MLHVITPKIRHNYDSMLDQFLKDRKKSVKFPKVGYEDAVYLVYIDDKYGQVGGAELYPTTLQSQSATYASRVPGLKTKTMFDVQNIFMNLPEDRKLNLLQDQSLKGRFYQSLYEGLTNFCLIKKVDTILSIVPLDVHLNLLRFGCWPFSYQGKLPTLPDQLTDNSESYVFGALDMDYSAYPQFQEKREVFEKDMALTAAQLLQRQKATTAQSRDKKLVK